MLISCIFLLLVVLVVGKLRFNMEIYNIYVKNRLYSFYYIMLLKEF